MNDRSWHLADMAALPDDVRFAGVKRKWHFRAVRYAFDPKRKFRCPPRGIFCLGKGLILIACLGQTLGEQ
jgi:hypothetical protein